MQTKNDAELLRDYVANRSEAAFTELVRRHLAMVYSAAFRQVEGDVHLAQDVAQLVFIDLARKSAGLTRHTSLTGWLYTSVRYAAATARRTTQRRQQREREAQAMNESLQQHSPATDWERLQPILDEALHALGNEDRHAILLRFLEGKTLAEVGHDLGLNENAARKRVERALEKLRHFFGRRGIAISAGILAETLSSKAIVAVPPSLAGAVATASLTASPAIVPFLKLMAITKLQLGAAAVAAAMATAIIVQFQTNHRLRQENGALLQQTAQMDQLRAENDRLAKMRAPANQPLAQEQLRELARLRAEAARLRARLAAAAKMPDEKPPSEPPAKSDADAAEQEKQLAIARLNHAKVLMLPMLEYAADHQNMFPTNLGQLSSYLEHVRGENQSAATSGLDDIPATGLNDIDSQTNQFEIVYQGATDQITNPANTIVIRETQAQQTSSGNWLRAYGFADGHSVLHSAVDGNFAPWEAQHIQNPGGGQ